MLPRVLFLAANPTDTSLLALDEEVARIESAIGSARSFDWYTERAVLRSRVRQLLVQQRPAILHFSGHGATDGLMLLDEHGRSSPLSGEALRRTCQAAGAVTRLAVLNACHTDEHARALAAEVDCVIGTTRRIRDDVARAFSRALYSALAAGQNVCDAFNAALDALCASEGTHDEYRDVPGEAPGSVDADDFTLHVRPGIDPERVVIGSPQAPPAEIPPGLEFAEPLIGRERELNALRDAFHGPPGIIAVWGLPGAGKSALARAHAWGEIASGRRVVWISGRPESSDMTAELLANIVAALDADATLYCDDVERGAVSDALRELAGRGRIVITTRDEVLASEHISLPVGPLPHDDAVQFLFERTGQHDAKSAGRIADAVGQLPLGLVQVASFVDETAATLERVCHRLDAAATGVLDTRAFDLVYDRIAERPEPRTLIQALGLFALERVARRLMPAFASAMMPDHDCNERELDQWLAAMRRHSLISVTADAIFIPRVVQQLVARRMTPAERTRVSRNGLELAWAQVADTKNPGSTEFRDLAARVILAIDPAVVAREGTEERETVARMFASASYRLGRFVDDVRGDPRRALVLFRQSAREQERFGYVNGMLDFNLALRKMAWTAARTGEAEWSSSGERAIAVARHHLPPAVLASTLNDVAACADVARDYDRAAALYRNVLDDTAEAERGTVQHASTLDNLAKVEHSLSDAAEGDRARDLLESAIRHMWAAMDIRIQSGDPLQKALGAHNLAGVLTCRRAFDRHRARAGLVLLRCARDVWRTTTPAWSDELASTTQSIVNVSNFLGEPSNELDEVKRLLVARREYLPARLTTNTFMLARIMRDESARCGKWNDVADAVFLLLDIHPYLDRPEDEKREDIAELLAWLGIAKDHGAVEDTEYETRVAANPAPTLREHEARLREQLGIPPRTA